MRCPSTALASQYTAQVLSPKVCWQAVVYYIPKILEAAGVEGDDAQLQLTILIGVCRTAFIAVGCYSVDRLGRRPLLVGSCAGISFALFLLSFGIATDAGTVVAIGVSTATCSIGVSDSHSQAPCVSSWALTLLVLDLSTWFSSQRSSRTIFEQLQWLSGSS